METKNMIEKGKSRMGQGFQARFNDAMFLGLDIMFDLTNKTALLTETDKAYIVELCLIFEEIKKELNSLIINDLQNGKEIKGCKLVKGRKSKIWKLPDDEIMGLMIKKGIDSDKFLELKTVSAFLSSIPKDERNSFNDLIELKTGKDYVRFKSEFLDVKD